MARTLVLRRDLREILSFVVKFVRDPRPTTAQRPRPIKGKRPSPGTW